MMNPDDHKLYRSMYLIRRFEERVLENFSRGVFSGTTHTYLGQEANAVGVLDHILDGDIVVSNHRSHGHFLAYGGAPYPLFAELMGKSTGICGGRGGSQHLHWRDFYSNGVLGGTVPMAAGMALAEKRKGSRSIAIAFLGDGTLGEGVVYETFNMASLWQLPILFVVENNHIAQTTPRDLAMAGDISARFTAFDISAVERDTSDVLEIWAQAGDLLETVRTRSKPHTLIIDTCRFGPHSKGDDTRPADELERLRSERDPITIHRARIDPDIRLSIHDELDIEISQAYQQALDDPYSQP